MALQQKSSIQNSTRIALSYLYLIRPSILFTCGSLLSFSAVEVEHSAGMGPKNSAATWASALQPKELSWIDRVYMKFETMCVEVDKNPSLLLQETSKYVGANVKKLCTELIQDLISTPMLTSEESEKKLECELHCKCHCMDFETPKLIETHAAAGVVNGTFDGIVYQKQDIKKKVDSKLNTATIVNAEVSKVETLNIDVSRELQTPMNFEACGSELRNIHGQNCASTERNQNTATGQFDMEDVGGHESFEEKLGLVKGIKTCIVQQAKFDSCIAQQEKYEDNCKSSDRGENKTVHEGSVTGAAMYKIESFFAEQGSIPKAKDNKELAGGIATHIIGATNAVLGSQEGNRQPQMPKCIQELQERDIEGLCKRPVSNIDFQTVLNGERELRLNTDVGYAKYKYGSISSAEDLQVDTIRDDEHELLPAFSSKEDVHDDEQSAHWFISEDLRKLLQPEVFGVEKSQYGDCFDNEFDLDWELL